MISSTALLKTPKILSLVQSQEKILTYSRLRWRRQLLLIQTADKSIQSSRRTIIPALQNLQWFEECLKHSSVKIVRMDTSLGVSAIESCAEACKNADKRVFLHLPAATYLPRVRSPLAWLCKRVADWLIAASLVVCLSPLLFFLAVLIWLDSPGAIFFKQWRVGHRGQLFKTINFRTILPGLHRLAPESRLTQVGRWLRRYRLDELPQLLNVLRGEMSLVGPQAWTVNDALQVEPDSRKRLNALPGITGAWQIATESSGCDLSAVSLSAVSQRDLEYLQQWTIHQDLKLLLLTAIGWISRLGAS